MSGERRRAITTPGERRDPARRGPASVALAVVLHVVGLAVLLRVVIIPLNWAKILGHPEAAVTTHVDYFQTRADTGLHTRAKAKAGGDNHAITKTPPPAPLVAPTEVPSSLPPEAPRKAEAPAEPASGSGPVVGNGGPTQGVTPSFADPRLWAPSSPVPVRPKTETERLDSAIATRVHHLEDSLAAIGPQRAPGDWTWGKDGKKFGIDQKYIHLGSFSIPTAVLALLPLNVQGNPSMYAAAQRIGQARSEILAQDARAMRDDDFKRAVKELRERMQKERADKVKADETLPDAPPPPRIVP